MAKTKDPDYVVARKGGGFDVQPPVVHPPRCICAHCRAHRPEHLLGESFVVRARRVSPYPKSRTKSAAYALTVKAQTERELRDAVAAAEARKEALARAVSVHQICAYYESWQKKEGKDWERDQYRVRDIEAFLGPARDGQSVEYADYMRFCTHLEERGCAKSTIRRYTNTLIAIFNRAVKARLIPAHHLVGIERPKVVTKKKPVIFTKRQVAVLLGSAMVRYEREQAELAQAFVREQEARAAARRPQLTRRPPSVVPLRGFCLIAYLTLMRPECNFELRWEQLIIDSANNRGRFCLDEHKNKDKGVEVDAPLKPELVRYLKAIMPSDDAEGLVHPNPETGSAYANIRTQWFRLVELANEILGPDEQLTGVRTHFYTWRHTGASHLAASSKDPILVTRMMGDTQLQTVMKHYFDSDFEHMQAEVERWQIPVESDPTARVRLESGLANESGIESGPN
jgi:integrase